MSITKPSDCEITLADISAVHIEAQPTVLKGSATQNKQVFDAYPDMIASHFNDLCTYLDTNISPDIDSGVQALYASIGWVQD